DTLKNYSGEQLEKTIQAAIRRTIKHHAEARPDTFTPVFCELESQRLAVLVHEWITLELHRPSFRVRETEQWHTVELADIQVRLKLDRVDECQDGKLIIIDYKTGQASSSEWLQERPGDPQLPLYAITTQGHVAALVFAKIRRGECKFDGFAEEDTLIPPVKTLEQTSWEEQLECWRTVMQQLANEYRQGIASVTPRDSQACRQCDLHGLCRIYEKCEPLGVDNE
ncbi:MAG: PD-(D/E)XK nuclease family protein, partial [Gammaproteobacteria bacterium]|nr:PD-(D/E)XK nuclease family protein [Gammaproteobacteria bacterium]